MVQSKELDFDRRDEKIKAMQLVTTEQVNALMKEIFFENPRRINLRLFSHAHRDDEVKRKEAQEINASVYENLAKQFGSTPFDFQTIDKDNIAEF